MNEKTAIRLLQENNCSQKVIDHCRAVAGLTRKIADRIPQCSSKRAVLGALLHDIGRSMSHSIKHAYEGAQIAEKLGIDKDIIGIIRNHIGAGLTQEEAVSLGLPKEDFMPHTIEEKVVAHADNLLKHTTKEKLDKILKRLRTEGKEAAAVRFEALHKELSDLAGIDLDEIEFYFKSSI